MALAILRNTRNTIYSRTGFFLFCFRFLHLKLNDKTNIFYATCILHLMLYSCPHIMFLVTEEVPSALLFKEHTVWMAFAFLGRLRTGAPGTVISDWNSCHVEACILTRLEYLINEWKQQYMNAKTNGHGNVRCGQNICSTVR
jgi:hypothetical protein